MKNLITKIMIVAVGAFILNASSANAKTPVGPETFGIGVQLGDPSALTIKVMPSEMFGFQFYVGGGGWGWNEHWNNLFVTGGDFIFHPVMIYDGWKTCALSLTLGAGAALGVYRGWWNSRDPYSYDRHYYNGEHYGILFVRLVTGVSLWFKKIPLEAFVEINPALRFINPDPVYFHMFWTFAGARWYF